MRIRAPTRRTSSPSRVAGDPAARLLAAMAEVAAEHGAANVTVAHVVARAGVSRRTFYELFEDREDCFIAAFDHALARAAAAIVPAYETEGRWRERVRSALAALLVFFDEEPEMARLLVVEALGAGSPALEARARTIDGLIAAVDEGRGEARLGKEPPPLTAEGVVGAVMSVLHARLLANTGARAGGRGEGPLLGLLGELTGMIVLPYLGQVAASRELARPAPSSCERGEGRGRRRSPARGPEHAPDLPHAAGPRRDRRAPREQQPSRCRHRGNPGPGAGLQAARPPAGSGPRRQHRRGSCQGRAQRLEAHTQGATGRPGYGRQLGRVRARWQSGKASTSDVLADNIRCHASDHTRS